MINGLKTFDLWEQGLGIPPTLPSFYWNVYSYEQRIKEICLRLERMLEYQDVQTDKINECVEQVNKLTEQVEALTKEVARLNQALLDEIEARKAGDQKLETELQKEINDRIKAINDEATTRQAQVDKLTTDLQAEAQTRQEQVNKLTSDLSTETTARTEADKTLQDNINSEATNRESADTTLQTNIDKVAGDLTTETNARTEAISGLDARVTQNTTQIANLTSGMPSVESDNIFTASTKVPTVNAIQASSNQAVTATNKLATMADVSSGGGGGGTTVNSIAPLTVTNLPTVRYNGLAFGDNAQALGTSANFSSTSIAIGNDSKAEDEAAIAIGTSATATGYNGNIAIGAGAETTHSIGNGGGGNVAIGRLSSDEGAPDDVFSIGCSKFGITRRIIHVSDPRDDTDGVNKRYVDNKHIEFLSTPDLTITTEAIDVSITLTKSGLARIIYTFSNPSIRHDYAKFRVYISYQDTAGIISKQEINSLSYDNSIETNSSISFSFITYLDVISTKTTKINITPTISPTTYDGTSKLDVYYAK